MTGPLKDDRIRSSRLGGRIKILETWYDDEPTNFEGCDVWLSHQRGRPVSPGGWLYFYTLHLDLTQAPEALLANMRKNYSRDIRQADTRDELTWAIDTAPTREALADYARFFDANPRGQGQDPMDLARAEELRRGGLVHLAQVQDRDGVILAQHCLLGHARHGIVQLFSLVSLHHGEAHKDRGTAIGRANRWLFYRQFLFYKERGFRIYDLNGWYAGVEDEKRLKINQFKEGFRGRVLFGYDCVEPLTLRGRVYLALRTLRRRLFQPALEQEHRRRRLKAPNLPEID